MLEINNYLKSILKDSEASTLAASVMNDIIMDCRFERSDLRVDTRVILVSYLLYMASDDKELETLTLEKINQKTNYQLDSMIKEYLDEEIWNRALRILSRYKKEAFLSCIFLNEFNRFDDYSTPQSISDLVCSYIQDEENFNVLDICCGRGNFLTNAIINNVRLIGTGCELNTNNANISLIKSLVLPEKFKFVQNNCFNLINDEQRYDFIFGNYPFGLKRNVYSHWDEYIENKSKSIGLLNKVSSEWIFNSLMIDLLNENGKAIAIMPDGGLFNTPDKGVRKYFIDNSYIESIISLPKNIFPFTSVNLNMIIFSKRKKEGVRFVDATKEFEKGRRSNYFSESNITNILHMLENDSENSKFVSFKEIENNDYYLPVKNYLEIKFEFENGCAFGDVVKSITRGAPLSANELDKISSNEPTDLQYLMLANIKGGIIDKELPYLKEIDKKYSKYCIKNNNLLISRFGAPNSPFKVAVAEIEDGKTVFANGNLYIIEVDTDKADPYYLKALFESEIGEKMLQRISTGTHIPGISPTDLKKLTIPLPPIEEQHRIAEKYAALDDEIKVLTLKIERIQEKKKSFLNL